MIPVTGMSKSHEQSYNFGCCTACRCIAQPDLSLNLNKNKHVSDLYNSFLQTNTQVINVSENKSKFMSRQLESAHMMQKVGAWPAIREWMDKEKRELDALTRPYTRKEKVFFPEAGIKSPSDMPSWRDLESDNLNWTKRHVYFEYDPGQQKSEAPRYKAMWRLPNIIQLPELLAWAVTISTSREHSFSTQNHEYLCCTECNRLMDLEGYHHNMLWANNVNTCDVGNDRLVPIRRIRISTLANSHELYIPTNQISRSNSIRFSKTGATYSAMLSYFMHRCLMNMCDLKYIERNTAQYRIFMMLPVIALKLVCLKLEQVSRWTPKIQGEGNRSSHNYTGVGNLFISYAMYMMYLIDYDEDDQFLPFPAFHHFYMGEYVSSPLWNELEVKDLWHFVLQSVLTNGSMSSVKQVQSVVGNLVQLYTVHVKKLVLVIHPNCPRFIEPYSMQDKLKITDDQFFVTKAQADELFTLHDELKSKDVTAFIHQIGFAAISTPMIMTFKADGDAVRQVLMQWMSRFVFEEQKSIARRLIKYEILTKYDDKSISLAAKCIYLMCNIRKKDLIAKNIITADQKFEDVLQFPVDRKKCFENLFQLPMVSVWKAALQLSRYGIAAKVQAVEFKDIDVIDDCVQRICLNTCADVIKRYTVSIPRYISLCTGKPLETLKQVLLE